VLIALQGAAEVDLGGDTHQLLPGHALFMPAGATHAVRAAQRGRAACCSPRLAPPARDAVDAGTIAKGFPVLTLNTSFQLRNFDFAPGGLCRPLQ
jgi:quercetin dioxygenase-like cupin family protein